MKNRRREGIFFVDDSRSQWLHAGTAAAQAAFRVVKYVVIMASVKLNS